MKDAWTRYNEWRMVGKEKQSLEQLIEAIPQFRSDLASFMTQASPIIQAVPKTFEEGLYISSLSAVTAQSGNVLTSLDINRQGGNSDIVDINLSMIGNINTFEKFLELLQTTLPFFDIMRFQLGAELKEFSISIRSFVLPPVQVDEIASFSEYYTQLESALNTNTDLLKNDAFKEFSQSPGLPVRLPTTEEIGKQNPFSS